MSSMDEVILAINFIEANLTKKMDLDMISGAVHYSKYHLHRVFSDTVGLTIHDYIPVSYTHLCNHISYHIIISVTTSLYQLLYN